MNNAFLNHSLVLHHLKLLVAVNNHNILMIHLIKIKMVILMISKDYFHYR